MVSINQIGQVNNKGNMKRSTFAFCVGNTSLEYVSVYKYLGVLFNESKKFKSNTD